MSKHFKYQVTIKFLRAKVDQAMGKKDVPRYLGRGATDKITFYKKKVVMELIRSNEYRVGDILCKSNNTINSQIIKVLMLYYANAQSFPMIKEIVCDEISPNRTNVFTLQTNDISQQFNIRLARQTGMNFIPIAEMYGETPLGNASRRALSHWLKALNVEDQYVKFNELWVAFNSLFAYYGNKKQERNNLIYIREQIQQNDNLFPLAKGLVQNYTNEQLRNSFRWMLLFTNSIKRGRDNFCESLFAFNDERILNMFKSLINSGRIHDKVVAFGKYPDLQSHLDTQGVTKDIDIVLLLCIKYAYFLRNRYQHGIVIANNFKIKENKDDSELPIINQVLSTLILELLKVGNALPCQQ